jgi:large subunit ribosomal protein L35
MPKMKTHKAAQKRFKVNGAGKIMQPQGPKGHLRRNKSARVRQQLDKMVTMQKANVKRTKRRLLPYGA